MDKTTQDVMFASGRGDHCTPKDLFTQLDKEFGFNCDVAASPENALCESYFHEGNSAFKNPWRGLICFCNPPYGRGVVEWVNKAANASAIGTTTVMLLPGRVDTKWFHLALKTVDEVRCIKGRLKFVGEEHGAPFPSILLVWYGSLKRYTTNNDNPYHWKTLVV